MLRMNGKRRREEEEVPSSPHSWKRSSVTTYCSDWFREDMSLTKRLPTVCTVLSGTLHNYPLPHDLNSIQRKNEIGKRW